MYWRPHQKHFWSGLGSSEPHPYLKPIIEIYFGDDWSAFIFCIQDKRGRTWNPANYLNRIKVKWVKKYQKSSPTSYSCHQILWYPTSVWTAWHSVTNIDVTPPPEFGYIDVDHKPMLMTLSWWQFFDISDRISILMTIFGSCCSTIILKDRRCWWQKRSIPSPTSQSCHKHMTSPTSVTNIDVTPEFFIIPDSLAGDDFFGSKYTH